MIQLNLDITKIHPQTGTYQEWLHHINQLIQHIETKVKPTNKKLINNNLTFSNLHQFDKQFKTSSHEYTRKSIIITHTTNSLNI